MGFYFKAEYELLFIAIIIVAIPVVAQILWNKLASAKRKKSCSIGVHAQYVTTDNYHYCYKRCACGKKWTLINR